MQPWDAVSEVPFVNVGVWRKGGLNMNGWRGDAPLLGERDWGTPGSHTGAMEGSEMERKHSPGSNTGLCTELCWFKPSPCSAAVK